MSDSRRRWATLSACVAASMCVGLGYSWSVFLKPMAAAHGWSSADVSLSYTALMSTAAAMAIVSGWALRHAQPRTLLLLGGVLFGLGIACVGSVQSLAAMYGFAFVAGMGFGIVYPGATMANLIRFFPDKGGFASGFLTAGAGIGAMVWGPLCVLMIERYGLTWTLRIFGLVFCVAIAVLSRLVATAPEGYAPAGWTAPGQVPGPAPSAGDDVVQKSWRQMLRSPLFYLLASLFLMGTVSGMLVIGQAAPIVQDTLSASAEAAGAAVTYLALGMVLGKIGWGLLSDRIGRYAVLVLLFVVSILGLLLMITTASYVPLVLGMSACALCYGGFVSVLGPVTGDAFGSRHLPVNFGIMFLSIAVAAYVGPQLAARVAEASGGDYTYAFIIAAAISTLGLLAAGAYMLSRRRRAALS